MSTWNSTYNAYPILNIVFFKKPPEEILCVKPTNIQSIVSVIDEDGKLKTHV